MKKTSLTDVPSEEQEQFAVAEYLRLKRVFFHHSPNEGKNDVQYIVKLKRLGMRVGFPDLLIFEPRGKFHGLAIELKRRKGGRVSDAQSKCLEELSERGYRAEVAKGFDEAKKIIDEYLKL